MSLRKLASRNEAVGSRIEQTFPGWFNKNEHQIGIDKFNAFRDGISSIYQEVNYQPQDELSNSSMRQLFLMKPVHFIPWLGCSRSASISVDCHNLTQVESLNDRHCTTIFYAGALTYDYANRRHLFNYTDFNYTSYFDSKEVVKLVLDFDPENYADLKRQIGARIIFHDGNHIASSQELDFFVTRGYKYDFNIEREDTIFNGKPYWNCYDYESAFLRSFETKIDPRVPLDMEGCFQNCVVHNMVKREKCWPNTMPFYLNDSMQVNEDIKSCTSFGETDRLAAFKETTKIESFIQSLNNPNMSMPNITWASRVRARSQQRFYMKVQRHCWSKCSLPCRKPSYSVVVARSPWPADSQVVHKSQEQYLRHCCALITVKFSHFHYNIQEYMPKYNLMDTLGNIGGLLAVWLGLSIVSVYQALQKCFEFCRQRQSNSRVSSIKVKDEYPPLSRAKCNHQHNR